MPLRLAARCTFLCTCRWGGTNLNFLPLARDFYPGGCPASHLCIFMQYRTYHDSLPSNTPGLNLLAKHLADLQNIPFARPQEQEKPSAAFPAGTPTSKTHI